MHTMVKQYTPIIKKIAFVKLVAYPLSAVAIGR